MFVYPPITRLEEVFTKRLQSVFRDFQDPVLYRKVSHDRNHGKGTRERRQREDVRRLGTLVLGMQKAKSCASRVRAQSCTSRVEQT